MAKSENNIPASEPEAAPVAPTAPEDDKVNFYAFKDGDKYKDDIFVACNGQSYKIRRGVTVRIPRHIADILAKSMEQDASTASMMERAAGDYNAASAVLNN